MQGGTLKIRLRVTAESRQLFLDSVGGGAWPFLVGGVIYLVNSDNERDSVLLNSVRLSFGQTILLRGTGDS